MSATSTRISSLLLAALLAACSREQAPQQQQASAGSSSSTTTQVEPQPEATLHIPCAHGAAALASDCTVDRAETDRGTVLIVRHADGGFRRLLVAKDGRGVVAADGSQPASVTVVDDGIEVRVGGDRYRLPATVKGDDRPL